MSDDAIKGIQRFFGRVKDFFSTQPAEKPDAPRYDVRAVPAFYPDRAETLRFIRETPLVYGYWGDFKRVFKQAETEGDRELLAALLARLDSAPFPTDRKPIPTPLDAANIRNFDQMALQENYAFLTFSQGYQAGQVSIVEISNPALPALVHTIPSRQTKDIAAAEDRLYILTGSQWSNDGKLLIYDVSDVRKPVKLGEYSCPRATQVVVRGNFVFLPCRPAPGEALQILDISDPSKPKQIGAFQGGFPFGIALDGDCAYLMTSTNQYSSRSVRLSILAIADPTAPRVLREIEIAAPTGMSVRNGNIYVTTAQGKDNFIIYEAPPGQPEKAEIAARLNVGAANSMEIVGRYAYAARKKSYGANVDSGGIAVVDIVEKRVVSVLPGNEVQALEMRDGILFGIVNTRQYFTQSLRAFDVSNPAKPYLIGTPPSRETVAYMKRRARRILREVAKQEPDAYPAFAAEILAQSGRGRAAIDFDTDWLTVPILFGSGKRYAQTQHDRGRFVCRVPAFVRIRREESNPELWDKTPQIAEPLFTNSDLPRETREFALRLLRHHALSLPNLTDAALASSLTSGSALLVSQAVRQIVTALDSGENVPPALAAEAYFRGSGIARRSISAFLDKTANDRKQNTAFAERLYALASKTVGGALNRKQQKSFALLAERFTPLVRSQVNAPLTVSLYATGRPDFIALAEDIFAHLKPNDLLTWLLAINTLDDAKRDSAFSLIRANISSQDFNFDTAKNMTYSPQTWVRESGWILLAESATPPAILEKLWNDLLNIGNDVTALATAFVSPAALSLISRISFNFAQLLNILRSRPQLLEWVTPEFFELLLPSLSLDGLLELIGEIPDAQWQNLRPAAISGLQKFDRGLAFWGKVFDLVNTAGDTPLSRRLFDDADLSETFVNLLDIGDLIRSANPAFGPLLGRWVAAHIHTFERDSAELLAIATSMQPEIRTAGLARVAVVGLSLPFALRLLESELPDAIEAGKAFFGKADAAQEMEYAVALCDSPQNSVRAYGLQYTQARLPEMDKAALFARLSENPNLKVQIWVAKELRTADSPGAIDFDRAVLRQRDKGRKAKEVVKKQIAKEPAPDVNLLLELARSRTPRDAEWAMQELAKLALTGIEIPGVALDGAAGG